ncbi:MAG: hypothetical protein IJ411_02240 [Oscillospiraceae bacterium]|nr:hypothetical protein [Oscillospiraceae bacterium]
MKRIKFACLEQTIHFMLKEEVPKQIAIRGVDEEYASYKAQMERNRTQYKIVEETRLEDGSLLIKIKKQYNNYDCGEYMD